MALGPSYPVVRPRGVKLFRNHQSLVSKRRHIQNDKIQPEKFLILNDFLFFQLPGMVLAPKTEHGMKARFKCKDGFKLTGPGGKEVIDENEYVLTCSFGNWTGSTPMCQELFCAFPGYVEHGKVLLIGNMGLYDYRPYVRKVFVCLFFFHIEKTV